MGNHIQLTYILFQFLHNVWVHIRDMAAIITAAWETYRYVFYDLRGEAVKVASVCPEIAW
jgi:hypothetical protein